MNYDYYRFIGKKFNKNAIQKECGYTDRMGCACEFLIIGLSIEFTYPPVSTFKQTKKMGPLHVCIREG